MRGKIDENMPLESAEVLRACGWECHTVFDEGLSGAADGNIAIRCQAEGRVLFTLDLDFADIRAYPPSEYPGIVVLRPVQPGRNSVLKLLREAIPLLRSESAEHRLWIIEPGRLRIREAGGPSD